MITVKSLHGLPNAFHFETVMKTLERVGAKRLQTTLVALLAMVGGATAQSLSIQGIETKAGEGAVLTVSVTEATGMTALQFNLALPKGVTLNDGEATMGEAIQGHTLAVETLENGDRLFVLYGMNMNTFKSGELLHIPVTVGSEAQTGNGRLYTVRMATMGAVSYMCEDVDFAVTVTEASFILGDVNGDGEVDISDYIGIANHILGNTPEGFNAIAADVNYDGQIDISDYIGVANIILTGSPTGK